MCYYNGIKVTREEYHELKDLEKFLRRFQILALNDQTSEIAAELLKQHFLSHGLLIPDALIAASSLVYDAPLLTKNRRDFRFIERLNLLPYA